MPNVWQNVDTNFPTFTGMERPREQIEALTNYMAALVEQLKYTLRNLDTSNWNSKALQAYTSESTEPLAEQVNAMSTQILGILNSISSILSRLSQCERDLGDVGEDILLVQQAVTDVQQELTTAQEDIDDLEYSVAQLTISVGTLETRMGDTETDLAEVLALVNADPLTGEVTIGGTGKKVYLVGDVYVNGTLI